MAKEVKELFMYHLHGIPQAPQWAHCRMSYDDEYFKIEHMSGGILQNKNVVNTFKIPVGNLVSADYVSEREIKERSKSVVGRGIAGAVIFGPAGLVLGGLSGVGTKQKTIVTVVFNLAYYSGDEIKTIVFQPGADPGKAKKFTQGIAKIICPPGQEFIL